MLLRVRAAPRSAAARVGGLHRHADGCLSLIVKVRAPPEQGKANKAVIEMPGRALRLAKFRFAVEAGESDRTKIVSIRGDLAEIAHALYSLVEQDR